MVVGNERRRGPPFRIFKSLRLLFYHRGVSPSKMDLFFKISTNTCFDRCAKLVDAILLKASAFLLSPLGTCLMVNLSKLWISDLVLSRLRYTIRAAMRSPAMRASYSASLFVAENSKRSAALLTKYTGVCMESLSVSSTALIAPCVADKYIINSSPGRGATSVGSAAICCLSSVKASSASVVQRKSPFFVHFLSVLNKGSDLSADLDRNLFKPANFPFNDWTSFIVRGEGSWMTAFVFSGHGLMPSDALKVSTMSRTISVLGVALFNKVIDIDFSCDPLAPRTRYLPVAGCLFLIILGHWIGDTHFYASKEALEGVSDRTPPFQSILVVAISVFVDMLCLRMRIEEETRNCPAQNNESGQLESQKVHFVIREKDEELREFTSEYYILSALHPVGLLPRDERPPPGSYSMKRIELKNETLCQVQLWTPQARANSVGSSEDADVAEVDSGLKRKRATGDDGAGPSKRVRHVSLGLSTSTEEETPDASPTLAAKEVTETPPPNVEATSDSSAPVTHAAQSPPQTGPKAFEGMPVDQLMEEFDMVTAQQAALVAQLRARLRQESSSLMPQNLAEEKRHCMSRNRQERAAAASTRQLKWRAVGDAGEKLRKLSTSYDESCTPHMLSTIAERRWLISHGLRLAAMSTLESQEVRQSFGDVVKWPARAYEELVAAMEAMKLLELPHIAQLERDQDYPIDVIMAGLTLARHATEARVPPS
ncbi:hypothetical protein Tco_0010361 [Tanacetum coccineum]